MITMYVMKTCPYCEFVEKQIPEGSDKFRLVDIGEHVHNLKEFLALRDSNPAFIEARKVGDVGIPCYVFEDGKVSLDSRDAGLIPLDEGASCNLDGSGC